MGKRPIYILSVTKDCEGYESWIEYVGTNYRAAIDRYIMLGRLIKRRWFLDEGDDEGNINFEVQNPVGPTLRPGETIHTYINNDDTCWMSIELACRTTGQFRTQEFETIYKRDYPNAKY